MARALLQGGADPNLKSPLFWETLLHLAVKEGRAEVVEVLLKAGADPNSEDDSGNKPLYYAAERNDENVGRILGKPTVILPLEAEKLLVYEESLRMQLFLASTGTTYFVGLDGQDPSDEFLRLMGKRLDMTLRKRSEVADQLSMTPRKRLEVADPLAKDGGRFETERIRDPKNGESAVYASIEITKWLSDTEAEILCTTWLSPWIFLKTSARARKRFGEWFVFRTGARWFPL